MWVAVTKALLVALVLALAVYDIVAYLRGGVRATISRIVLSWATRWPVVVLALGIVLGHVLWPQPTPGLCDCACEEVSP